jgi:transcriptional regulator with XRE-family HTH domain
MTAMWEQDESEALWLLGGWIARWRQQVGVSQRSLAARAGIDQGGLSRVERGLQVVGARRLGKLIAALDELSSQGSVRPIAPPPVRPPRAERAEP